MKPVPIAGVYALFEGGVIVYIGRTTDIRTRIMTHTRNWPDVSFAFVACKNATHRELLESYLIRKLSPARNRSLYRGNRYIEHFVNGSKAVQKLRDKLLSQAPSTLGMVKVVSYHKSHQGAK